MAFLLGCENVRLEFPTAHIFESLTLGVDTGDRIGIVGRNGDGKSSLLGVLAQTCPIDDGRVVRTSGVRVGVLSQRDDLDDDFSVHRNVVGERPDYEWAADARTRSIIDALVGDLDWEAPVANLSGGQRRRVDLARVLIGDWDVLMLDEPTNHLDMGAIAWLADHLKNRWKPGDGAMLVVTHDRWFLDEVCLAMWEVHDTVVTPFEGGYSAYIQQRVERDRQMRVAESKRRNILRKELAWLARGAPARSTKPRFRVEAARELIADEPPLRSSVELKRSAMSRLGKKVIDLEDAGVTLSGKQIIAPLEWHIGAGDRIGILGANGAGKTTMLRLIQGLINPTQGSVEIGQTVRFAVLSQQLEGLEEHGDERVRELCAAHKSRCELADGRELSPSQLLQDLGFDSDQLSCPVKDLSGGQKRRLQLMLILLDKPNVLILDEPGNDLDTDMLAQVEGLLDTWPGTLLLVTHDRYLMERVTDDQYALLGGKLVHMPRGVEQYLEELEYLEQMKTGKAAGSKTPSTSSNDDGALSQKEQRALKKEINSLDRRMSTLRGKLDKAREALGEIAGTDFVALGEQQAKIDELESQLAQLEDEWLEKSEMLSTV